MYRKYVTLKCFSAVWLAFALPAAWAYPLDGQDESGIRRLEGYRLAQEEPTGPKLMPGQLWGEDRIQLHLLDYDGPDFDDLPEDPGLTAFLSEVLQERDPSYAMVLVDLTNAPDIRWAGLRPDLRQNAGSVGKMITMAALFQALSEAFPDVTDRADVLREAESSARDWVSNEIHAVPKWDPVEQVNNASVIQPQDRFRLSEWLDHAISASANGAGAIVWREAMLIRHFGAEYPKSDEESERFFRETSKAELGALALSLSERPLIDAGIDTANLRQGSMWTRNGKLKVPGVTSYATPRELARFVFRMEEGRMVDRWSSLQMKKYMYLTKRRYRYAYDPELADAAVFFKSGSLYSCQPEEGFRCGKYMGNKTNYMNSVAEVETGPPENLAYFATLLSNVLRFNSAWDHARIGAAVHETMRTNAVQNLQESASEKEMIDAGKSE